MTLAIFRKIIVCLHKQYAKEEKLKELGIAIESLTEDLESAFNILFDSVYPDPNELFWDWIYGTVINELEEDITEEYCKETYNKLCKN